METKEIGQQIKLGAFVLAGLALFLAGVFLIGKENNIFSRTFELAAEFKNVEGLKEGDNVWLSGVKIGVVSDVSIVSEGKVVVKFALKSKQNEFIRKDATASIGSDGLVGNKIVVIRPGSSPEVIHEKDTINATSPADTQELINIAKEVGQNTRSLTLDLSVIARRVNEGKGIVGELLNEGAIARELRAAIGDLRTTSANTAQASRQLHQLLYEMRNGNGLMPTLISDTAYVRTFRNALTNIQSVSINAERLSADLQHLSSDMNANNNALGVLLNDSIVAGQLKNTVEHASQASEKLDENLEALQHTVLFRRYFRKQEKKQRKGKVPAPPKGPGD